VEAAFGIARCLCGAEAGALMEAAAAAAQQEGRKPGGDLRVWFLRALMRAHRQRYSDRAASDGEPKLDDTPDLYLYARSAAAGLPVDGSDPAADLLERLGPDRVFAAMRRLAEEYRLVCSCHFLGDLTYGETALVLEYPVGTVRARLHRGRRMLQKSLWQVALEDGIAPSGGEPTT
jgi:RNA polymerase sigma-70 factor (ECF subfamily)